ncbi:MAG: hypothetical protein UT48_C0001G0063 [Parcubacteria group bacterium GW2011_GWE2_39_37]|uniref:Histidine-specific methyltransferase SAM-dependent domain-containing protein n=1 Tax=Candidatus Falkowbacteria bacterium GW2011_GWF2_39_8 TaxID=1618642 RepID=A0A0G0Q8Y4_9BACT|nr:MAG: hypothetical protein UT48_C0001G0063 [Parcubacteria group bacterium GW2011_GWE2_39_37]KKR33786.1 MAG: hypothetical protein UT64_C0003G0007 [Candidatus Falkowbacteria bacterium GW2011_GWF2_39_8]
MKTKCFYEDGLWQAIEAHPKYDLGKRELEALIKLLPVVANAINNTIANLFHLGIGNGREIKFFIENFPVINTYLANDICAASLSRVIAETRKALPEVNFIEAHADVELKNVIKALRDNLFNSTLIALVANAVIFSNRSMDKKIHDAMHEGDYFIVTLESYHSDIFKSYAIEPVYDLLSKSGLKVTAENVDIIYEDQCLKMLCEDELLLSSYKPTVNQLRARMASSGFKEVLLQHYEDIHMIGALYKR